MRGRLGAPGADASEPTGAAVDDAPTGDPSSPEHAPPDAPTATTDRGDPASNDVVDSGDRAAAIDPTPALSPSSVTHHFNGIAASPDGRYVFVNSGSRSDHGELQEVLAARSRQIGAWLRNRAPADRGLRTVLFVIASAGIGLYLTWGLRRVGQ
jgi:hypothetical protein